MTKIAEDKNLVTYFEADQMTFSQHLETCKRQVIYAAMEANDWNMTAAARDLGITFRQLRYHCMACGLRYRKAYTEVRQLRETFNRSWPKLRLQAFLRYGNRCMCCGATPSSGAELQVDHVKPRSIYPDLAYDMNNLQILCRACNASKHVQEHDWRIVDNSL